MTVPRPRRPDEHPSWCTGLDDAGRHRSKIRRINSHIRGGQVVVSMTQGPQVADPYFTVGVMRGIGITATLSRSDAQQLAEVLSTLVRESEGS